MMIKELEKIKIQLSGTSISQMYNLIEEEEAKEYLGYNFEADNLNFKFRKSKITPKKVGQFVTLWKRNLNNETEPFNESDNFDFYIILTEDSKNYGFFLFPKKELIKRHILSTNIKEGKRGFRLYPKWTKTENKQAEKTKIWQNNYFLEFTNEEAETMKRLIEILSYK